MALPHGKCAAGIRDPALATGWPDRYPRGDRRVGSRGRHRERARQYRTRIRGGYSAKKLRDLAGRDAYRDEALGAAHELLADPIAFDGGNKYDAASRQYLFMVLEMYQDKTFIETAQEMFVKEDGRIDRSVLRYFEQVGRSTRSNPWHRPCAAANCVTTR